MAEKAMEPYEIGELDHYLYGQGNHYEIYKKLGAHLVQKGKKKGVYFAVWAPHAKSVSVVGDFNDWDMEAESDGARRAAGDIYVLCSGREKRMNSINIVLRHVVGNTYLRRIPMRIMRN